MVNFHILNRYTRNNFPLLTFLCIFCLDQGTKHHRNQSLHYVYHPQENSRLITSNWLRFTTKYMYFRREADKCFVYLNSYLIHDIAASHLKSEHVVMTNLPPFPSNGWWCIGGGGGGGGNRKQLWSSWFEEKWISQTKSIVTVSVSLHVTAFILYNFNSSNTFIWENRKL